MWHQPPSAHWHRNSAIGKALPVQPQHPRNRTEEPHAAAAWNMKFRLWWWLGEKQEFKPWTPEMSVTSQRWGMDPRGGVYLPAAGCDNLSSIVTHWIHPHKHTHTQKKNQNKARSSGIANPTLQIKEAGEEEPRDPPAPASATRRITSMLKSTHFSKWNINRSVISR